MDLFFGAFFLHDNLIQNRCHQCGIDTIREAQLLVQLPANSIHIHILRASLGLLLLNRRQLSSCVLVCVIFMELVLSLVNFGANFTGTTVSDYPRGTLNTASMIRYIEELEEDSTCSCFLVRVTFRYRNISLLRLTCILPFFTYS